MIINNLIFHIANRKTWEKGRQLGKYSSETLEKEGFIDCLTKDKIIKKANKKFLNKKDLLLLYIDPTLVNTKIKSTIIYGPIDTDAVVRIVTFNPQADGTFVLPPDLQ